jgi:hypothetical protein
VGADSLAKLTLENDSLMEITMYDARGRLLRQTRETGIAEAMGNNQIYSIDFSGMPKGFCFLKVKTWESSHLFKVLLKE